MELREMLKNQLEERAKSWEKAKAHIDAVEADDTRSMTGEDEATMKRFMDELDGLDAQIGDTRKLLEGNEAAEEARALAERLAQQEDEDRGGEAGEDSDLKKLRALARGEVRSVEFRFAADDDRRFATGEVRESRDLTVGTTTAGGHTVPTSFLNRLYEHLIENTAIRQTRATVINTDSGEALQVPKTTAHGGGALVAEGGAIGESDPTFGQVTLNAYKYGVLAQVSSELMTDTGVDLVGYLARQGGRAIGNAAGVHFITGDGSSKPQGITTVSTLGKTAAGAAAITFDELIDLFFSVIAPYRMNAEWMLKDSTLGAIRKLKDSDGQYLWQPGLTEGQPDTILGKHYVTDPNMPAMTTGLKSVLFGDFSAYTIRDVNGIRIEQSADYAFGNDLVTWRFLLRTDGDLVDTTGAVKHLIQA